jgi:predicted phosphohydrolase
MPIATIMTAPTFHTASIYLTLAAPYMSLGALVLAVAAIILLLNVRRRLMRLSIGRSGSLEETIAILSRDMKDTKVFRSELEKYLKVVEMRLRSAVSGVSVVRFNPFSGDGSGGNQSFAAAFLDENGKGMVFSSLYARDRMAVYGKPVEHGTSPFEMTDEEKDAIARAQQSIVERKAA